MRDFPPRTWDQVELYADDDIVEGYRDHALGDAEPGPNRSPGYRWGWTNARKDATGVEDGFEDIRAVGIAKSRQKPTIH